VTHNISNQGFEKGKNSHSPPTGAIAATAALAAATTASAIILIIRIRLSIIQQQ